MINTTQERLTRGWKLPKLVKLTATGKDQWLWHHQLHNLVISTVWVYYLHMSNLQISIYHFKVILWLERELVSFKSPLLSDTSDQKHTCLLFYCRQYENWNKKWRSLQLHIWSLVTMLQTNTHTQRKMGKCLHANHWLEVNEACRHLDLSHIF